MSLTGTHKVQYITFVEDSFKGFEYDDIDDTDIPIEEEKYVSKHLFKCAFFYVEFCLAYKISEMLAIPLIDYNLKRKYVFIFRFFILNFINTNEKIECEK